MTLLNNNIPLLQGLPGITAFSTVRGDNANDADPYSGLNVCHYTGDNPSHICECRAKLAKEAGVSDFQLVIPRQTHSDNVTIVSSLPCAPDNCDAIVAGSDVRAVLCVNTADCLPVVFADPDTGIIGIAHAGWRGIVNGILQRTILAMRETGAHIQSIHAEIGPHICGNCYETDAEFAKQFSRYAKPADKAGKAYVDLATAAASQLHEAGLSHVADCGICTYEHPSKLFSARRHGVASGRILTAIYFNNSTEITR